MFEIDPKTEEQLTTIGATVKRLFKDIDDEAVVLAVMCGVLNDWATNHGYNPVTLANLMYKALAFTNLMEEDI